MSAIKNVQLTKSLENSSSSCYLAASTTDPSQQASLFHRQSSTGSFCSTLVSWLSCLFQWCGTRIRNECDPLHTMPSLNVCLRHLFKVLVCTLPQSLYGSDVPNKLMSTHIQYNDVNYLRHRNSRVKQKPVLWVTTVIPYLFCQN